MFIKRNKFKNSLKESLFDENQEGFLCEQNVFERVKSTIYVLFVTIHGLISNNDFSKLNQAKFRGAKSCPQRIIFGAFFSIHSLKSVDAIGF